MILANNVEISPKRTGLLYDAAVIDYNTITVIAICVKLYNMPYVQYTGTTTQNRYSGDPAPKPLAVNNANISCPRARQINLRPVSGRASPHANPLVDLHGIVQAGSEFP